MIGQTKEREINMKQQKGFTLIEMLVVITIIAILSAVLLVGFSGFVAHAKDVRAEQTVREIRHTLFLETSESPYAVTAGEDSYTVSYDHDSDTFIVTGETVPDDTEGAAALSALFTVILDSDTFAVNPIGTVDKETIDIYAGASNVTIEYSARDGGGYLWIPNITYKSFS